MEPAGSKKIQPDINYKFCLATNVCKTILGLVRPTNKKCSSSDLINILEIIFQCLKIKKIISNFQQNEMSCVVKTNNGIEKEKSKDFHKNIYRNNNQT